jgi:hypothetical protein
MGKKTSFGKLFCFSVALFGGLSLWCMICGWAFAWGSLLVLVEDLPFALKSFC